MPTWACLAILLAWWPYGPLSSLVLVSRPTKSNALSQVVKDDKTALLECHET